MTHPDEQFDSERSERSPEFGDGFQQEPHSIRPRPRAAIDLGQVFAGIEYEDATDRLVGIEHLEERLVMQTQLTAEPEKRRRCGDLIHV